jgi:hypothetical protein
MTDDNYVSTDVSMDISTDNTHTDDIMTDDIQLRAIGKPKVEKDPNALKLASFRTKEGIWAEFCQKAETMNLTATDVLKAAMDQFIAGEYDPRVYVPSRHNDNVLTRDDVLEIVTTAINTSSKHDGDVLTRSDVLTIVSEHIDSDDTEQRIKAQVEPLADLITELEAYTRSQIETLRNDIKKPTAIAR